ncbi:hypothetical protein [Amycolatopsis sp.]|jgi:hypothetical protein|uniref:hypothetical protein n=1 Tax=Amycolatopsis sp. TaxID=37632 RepID=UPI002DF953F9|nr:hypothetical protein [Amycolatopsis sp.]
MAEDAAPTTGRSGTRELPHSVDDLATDPEWEITRNLTNRQWIIAECRLDSQGRRWVIGMTPIRDDVVAAILWADDTVAEHARGTETAMCATAHGWVTKLRADAPPPERAREA